MKIYYELNLDNFEAWSGAVDTLDRIRQEGKVQELEAILEELYPDGMSETELNDLLWFEDEAVFEWLGMKTDEELEAEEDEEEEQRQLLIRADAATTFDEFCSCFDVCLRCPLYEPIGFCESLWKVWKRNKDEAEQIREMLIEAYSADDLNDE